MEDMIKVICEDCQKEFEVDHLEECTYIITLNGAQIGEHKLCRECSW